jgi:hypothetical protein
MKLGDLDAPIQTDLRRILFKGRFNLNHTFSYNDPEKAALLQWDSISIKYAEKAIFKMDVMELRLRNIRLLY